MTNRRPEDDRLEPLWREAARSLDEQPRAGADAASCLEAETLAAWVEHRLGAAETAALERHAAACPRCRALIAAFATTQPAPAAAPAPWWKTPLIRWVAPAAAVAAAAIVWVSVERAGPVELQDAQKAADVLASAQPPPMEGPLPVTPSQQAIDAVTSAPAPPRAAAPAPPAPVQDLRRETQSAAAGRSRAAEAPEPERPAGLAEMVTRAPGAALSSGVLELMTPDPQVRWRVRGDLAERTADAGATWTSSPLPASGPFTAGTCPSADVCWLAGAGGLVLRTTDGNAWTTAARADAADLTTVTASDALRAEVTTADGRVFVTADGGKSWSLRPLRLPPQESPAAPF